MGRDNTELTENGKKTRDLIFQTAVRILKEEGYDKVTVRRICKESNTSNGSFYHFFKNKDELMAYYYTRSADDFLAGQEETMKNADLYHQMLICYRWYIRYTADFGLDFCINFFNSNNRPSILCICTMPFMKSLKNVFTRRPVRSGKVMRRIRLPRSCASSPRESFLTGVPPEVPMTSRKWRSGCFPFI